MANRYKVTCKVDKGNGWEDYTLFVGANDERQAEQFAKAYVIGEGWGFQYGSCKQIK